MIQRSRNSTILSLTKCVWDEGRKKEGLLSQIIQNDTFKNKLHRTPERASYARNKPTQRQERFS